MLCCTFQLMYSFVHSIYKAIHYRTKKDAQDAHEAIRPTEVTRTPDSLASYLNKDELRLYRLIWQRFVASQMTPAVFDQTTIDIGAGRFIFRATGSVQKFDGFLKLYQEGRDENSAASLCYTASPFWL